MSTYEEAPAGSGSGAGQVERTSDADLRVEDRSPTVRVQPPIPSPPTNGIHSWMMEAAWACRRRGMPADEAAGTLYGFEGGARRRFQPREVEDAVAKAYGSTGAGVAMSSGGRVRVARRTPPPKPEWKPGATWQIHRDNPLTVQDWRDRSPIAEPWKLHPRDVLKMLFADGDTLVCGGLAKDNFATAPLDEWEELERHQFVVPGPMSAVKGTTQKGNLSYHSLDNTGARKFIVTDFDDPPPEQHPSIIGALATVHEPALVMSSGGKSLHAWFPVFDDAQVTRRFWHQCLLLGADPVLKTRSQFVRMPNGTRDNGRHQSVHFLNPQPLAEQ